MYGHSRFHKGQELRLPLSLSWWCRAAKAARLHLTLVTHLSRTGQQWGTDSQPCAVLPWASISLFIWYARVQRFYGKSGKQDKVHPKSLISVSSCHLKEQLPQFLFVHLASDFLLLKICSLTKPYDCHSSPCLLAGDSNPRSPRALSVTDCLSQQGSGEGSAGQASAHQPGVLTQDWFSVSRG